MARCEGRARRGRAGFVSFHALAIMVFASIAGAFLLQGAAKESGTAGGYFHKRGSTAAARAALSHAVSQLESDSAAAMAFLRGYLADPSRSWLLGTPSSAGSPQTVTLASGQTYTARLLSFDTATHMAKILGEGSGLGGSVTKVTGLYRLDGLGGPEVRETVTHALFLAGGGHALGAPLKVEGPSYFGGGFLVQPGAAGTEFQGPVKVASDALGTPVVVQGGTIFADKAWFESPVRFQAGATFRGSVGFDDEAVLDAGISLQGANLTGYANGSLAGVQRFDLGGNPFRHSGFVPSARLTNTASIDVMPDDESISAALGIAYGAEKGLRIDLSGLPVGHVTYASSLILPDAFTSEELEYAYHKTHKDNRFGPLQKWQVIVVDKPMSLVRSAVPEENENFKCVIMVVRSTLDIGGNLWKTTVCDWGTFTGLEGNVVFLVQAGGQLLNMGGNDRFRGSVIAEAGATVTYRWGPGGSLVGAVHHVDAGTIFGLVGPHPFTIRLDQPTLEDIATSGLLRYPPAKPPLGPAPRLADLRIRPRLLGFYY